jgi:hypothetical protein
MSQVLAMEFVAVRQQRKQLKPGATAATAAAAGDNTLPAESISLLRHAFILIAGEHRVGLLVLCLASAGPSNGDNCCAQSASAICAPAALTTCTLIMLLDPWSFWQVTGS